LPQLLKISAENSSASRFLYNEDQKIQLSMISGSTVSLVYGDCIYESMDFSWVHLAYNCLILGGIFIVQTDWHTQHRYRVFLEDELGMNFVSHLVWKNEWGNHPKNRFHQCYDDILVYSKGMKYKFYPERIQVPKATANTKLNPSGRMTKTATAWVDDITLTTTAKERVKKDGHNVRWQKPIKLYDRIIAPFTDYFDIVLDPFMGTGSLGRWCRMNQRSYIGIEIDPEIYMLATENINN
jgi:DNA modification methylase